MLHLQITRPEQLERLKKDGLIGYIQPVFLDYDARIAAATRRERRRRDPSYAFETMRRMGIPVSSGTDCPVENPLPMRGVQCARHPPAAGWGSPAFQPRRSDDGGTMRWKSYTAAGAYASFEETVKGKIQKGMLADFTVWSGSPFDVSPDRIAGITAREVFLGGKQVFAGEM